MECPDIMKNKTKHTKKEQKHMRTKKKHLRKMIEKLKHNKLVDNFTSSNAFNTNWAAVQHFKLRQKKSALCIYKEAFSYCTENLLWLVI